MTVAWQEPVTAMWAVQERAALEARWEGRAVAVPRGAAPRPAGAPRRGEPVARVRLRSARIDDVVVHGARPADLRRAPGSFGAWPPSPTAAVAIAGHRTTWGAPFRHLDRARPGDLVLLELPGRTRRYRVRRVRIVGAGDVAAARVPGGLALVACHPLLSAAQRIVVTATAEAQP